MRFSEASKHVISVLSSGRCSNPSCRISLLVDFKLIGRFCHIEGEKEKAARYNPKQSDTERNSPKNGILLCSNCHTLIDSDPIKYTTEILHKWKETDHNSPKTQDWLDKGIPLLSIVSYVKNTLPIRPRSYIGERSLFLGRNSEIKKLTELITTRVKVISVVGEGGIGKTSVSVKTIKQLEDLFEIIIPITLTQDTSFKDFLQDVGKFINSSFLNSLNSAQLEGILREILANVGRTLFFIDNYENVTDFIDSKPNDDLRKIHSFLESLPENVQIIVNSRNRSNLEAETSVVLEGLSSDDGVNLFVQMAKNYFSDSPPSSLISKIGQICNMVEGLPLAIKLLGSFYRGGGISRLTEMHDELFTSIENNREPTERLRSISACFNYSYSRLSPKMQNFLMRLSLFESFFTAEFAKEIFGIQESILTEFFQKSLLQRSAIQCKDGSEIFVYDFHPVIKGFLVGIRPEFFSFTPYEFKRYVKSYSNFVRILYNTFSNDILKNFRLVELLTAGSSNDLWAAINSIENEEDKSVISNLLGLLLLQTGFKSRALLYHKLCLEIDRKSGNLDNIANDLTLIASCNSDSAYSEEALSIRAKLAKNFEANGEHRMAGRQYISIGLIFILKGDYDSAESNLKISVSEFKKGEVRDRDIADASMNLTVALIRNKKYQEAIDCAKDTIKLYEKLKDPTSVASAKANLSHCYKIRNEPGDLKVALEAIESAQNIDENQNNTRHLIRDYRIMAEIYYMMNDGEHALEYYKLANDEISNLEKTTGERFTDTSFYDFLEYSDR